MCNLLELLEVEILLTTSYTQLTTLVQWFLKWLGPPKGPQINLRVHNLIEVSGKKERFCNMFYSIFRLFLNLCHLCQHEHVIY